jgi:hypothetical protein
MTPSRHTGDWMYRPTLLHKFNVQEAMRKREEVVEEEEEEKCYILKCGMTVLSTKCIPSHSQIHACSTAPLHTYVCMRTHEDIHIF